MSYTLIVGTKDWSSWSLRPYLALRATGQPFEEIVIRLREAQHNATRDAIRKYLRRRTRAGAEDRGRRQDRHGVG